MSAYRAYADPKHKGNDKKYRTGKRCIEPGCKREAGTWWSPLWCRQHNTARMDRISGRLDPLLNKHEENEL